MEDLYRWIDVLQSQENLAQMKVMDYPHMKKEARERLQKDLYRQGFPKILRGEPKSLSVEDLEGLINGRK